MIEATQCATEGLDRPPVDVLGSPFHPYTFDEVVALVRAAARDGGRLQVVPGNVDFVMKARRNPAFSKVLGNADLVVADGVPIVWAASLLGTPLRGRVSGTELVEACASISAELDKTVALVGAGPGVAERAAEVMRASHPGARLVYIETPFPMDQAATDAVLEEIARQGCAIVLAALGAPRQEDFAAQALDVAGANVAIGVGSALDIISGDRPRAPQWMCDHGLEWLHRLRQEPRRLGRRYVLEDSPFLFHLSRSLVQRRFAMARRAITRKPA
jgi:N-acetylglucosaminyldiphosphoundecaprenol N-acetyl-beta-D-mannosaminyltransferase